MPVVVGVQIFPYEIRTQHGLEGCLFGTDAITMPDNTKLTEVITRCHGELDELFLLHQEAVLLGRFDGAIQLLNYFEELHHLHMSFEDEELIPKLAQLGDQGRWPVSLYTGEHSKVQELMGKTRNSLLSLSEDQLSNKSLRRRIIGFLDKEKTFKGLLEHHQEREEAGMLPELDGHTDTRWRVSVIKPFLKEWNYRKERNMSIVNGIDFP
jgi:hypothetical protein